MYISYPVLGQANESINAIGRWMKLIPVEEWFVCGRDCVSVGMVWDRCGALAPRPQFYAPLPPFCAALAFGKLIYSSAGLVWDWHVLSFRVPAVQTCYCFNFILFVKHSLQEGASLRSWHVSLMKTLGLFLLFWGCSCQNSAQPSPVIFSVAHFRENASNGKGCQLGPGLFTPGSGREQ